VSFACTKPPFSPPPANSMNHMSCLQILDQKMYFDLANVFSLLVTADFTGTWETED